MKSNQFLPRYSVSVVMVFTEPPERDNVLPDLHRLMDSLEDGHSDLDSQNDPPSLFTRPEHVPKYKKITELKMEIEVTVDNSLNKILINLYFNIV